MVTGKAKALVACNYTWVSKHQHHAMPTMTFTVIVMGRRRRDSKVMVTSKEVWIGTFVILTLSKCIITFVRDCIVVCIRGTTNVVSPNGSVDSFGKMSP